MSTYAQLYVYACPPEQARAVLDVLDDHGLFEDFHDGADGQTYVLLGAPGYGRHQVAGDLSDTIAEALHREAPGVLFQTWTDPAEDYLGAGAIAGPDGLWQYESTADGDPVFTGREILARLAAGDPLEEILGAEWTNTIDEARAALPEDENARRVRLPECDACHQRVRCGCEEDLAAEAYAVNAAVDRDALTPA